MDDLGIIGVRKNYEKMQSEMFRCSLETGLPLPTTWSEDEWRKFFQWLSKQGDKGDSGEKTETTCEFKLKGHRGYEDQYDIEKRMCASEMGLNDPKKWSFYDWEVFVNWQDVFHEHDIVSGPDAKRLSDEKEARAKRARDWFDKHKDLYGYKKNDNTNENKKTK